MKPNNVNLKSTSEDTTYDIRNQTELKQEVKCGTDERSVLILATLPACHSMPQDATECDRMPQDATACHRMRQDATG